MASITSHVEWLDRVIDRPRGTVWSFKKANLTA